MRYIITGASSGIGKRCAERLLEQGNECLLLARSENKLQEIKEKHNNAIIKPLDLSNLDLIEGAIKEAQDMYPFDGLIHCAGIAPLRRTDENDAETLRNTYATNVFSFVELMSTKPSVQLLMMRFRCGIFRFQELPYPIPVLRF